MIYLRDYQLDIFNQVLQNIDKKISPLVQLDTGAGKTPIIAALCEKFDNFIVLTHRNFLVTQVSMTMSKMHIKHDTLSSKHTRNICEVLAFDYNTNLIHSDNRLVASVDTLLSRKKRERLHFDINKEWIVLIDEAHHALDDNKWGILKRLLPFAVFVGFTATPIRYDHRCLESQSGGLFDCLVQAEKLRTYSVKKLIKNGYLSNFKYYFASIGKEVFEELGIEKPLFTYDFEKKYIKGEYIKSYKKLAKNKRAIVMCKNIKEAELVAEEFREAGFSAMCISSRMTRTDITKVIDNFKNGIVKILCNVAMIDEGFDVPEAECLIMLRTTNFRRYRQWCGRVLRPKENNNYAIIIDHGANFQRFGLPDEHVNWRLSKIENYHTYKCIDCIKCGFVFNYKKLKCPECGHVIKIDEEDKRLKIDRSRYREVMTAELRRVIQTENIRIEEMRSKESFKYQIQIPEISGKGIMITVIKYFAEWFADSMKINITKNLINYESLNEFMKIHFNSIDFWINNFNDNDRKNLNPKKCLIIYKKYKGKIL